MTTPDRHRIGLAMDAATAALRGVGADTRELSVLRVSESVLVRAPHANIIARVERPGRHALAERVVRAARVMAQREVPAARLVAPDHEPWEHEGGIVTLWEQLQVIEGTASLAQLGHLARRLHDSTADASASAALPAIDLLGGVTDRSRLDLLEEEDAAFLSRRAHALRLRYDGLYRDDPLGMALVHGDLNEDNVVLTPEGPMLLDFELSGWGPRSWDFVVPWLAVRRYGRPEPSFLELLSAYGGADPRQWSGFDVLCEIYELHATAWALGLRHQSPAFEREGRLRVATLRGAETGPWTLL